MMNNKAERKKLFISAIIVGIISILLNGYLIKEKGLIDIVVILKIINGFCVFYPLVILFSNISKGKITKDKENPKINILMISYSIFALSGLILLYIERGTIFKVQGLINIFIIIFSVISLISKKNKNNFKEMTGNQIYKFGYFWLLGVLLIPVILILILKGY